MNKLKIQSKHPPTSPLAGILACLLAMTLPAKAAVLIQTVVPITITVSIDCDQDGTPEDVVPLSGNLYVLVTSASNNTVITLNEQFVPREVNGTGLITGETYRGVGTTQSNTVTFQGPFSGSYISTFENNFYIIGQGSGYRFLEHDTVHLVVFSDGSVIADVDNSFTTCPGG
jgi:hypothetical protein